MDERNYLRSAEMNRGDLAMDHSAKWDLSSSIESSSLRERTCAVGAR